MTLDWIRRHPMPVAVGLAILGTLVAAIFFPKHDAVAMTVTVVLVAVFTGWAQTPLARLKSSTAGVPSLTIAEHFKRTRAYFIRIMVAVMTGWIAVITLFPLGIPRQWQQVLGIGGACVLSLIGALILKARLRCPRCGTALRKERIATVGRWAFDTRSTEEIWDSCPHCGVSFNDPWP